MPPSNEVKLNDLGTNDLLIAIMGPTGSGKSTIIDHLTDYKKRRSSSKLKSYTKEIGAVRIQDHPQYGNRIVLIDTPGFDDTERSDMEILDMIANWLKETYKQHVPLAGIMYLHRIADNRMGGTPHRNLRMFGKLCGENAAKKVLLVSTMWDAVSPEVAETREAQLKKDFWKSMLDKGADVGRSYNNKKTAQDLVDIVLKETHKEAVLHQEAVLLQGAVLLQEELVDLERKLNETSAGKELYSTLQRLLSEQKQTVALLAKQARDNQDSKLAKQLDQQLQQIQRDLEATFQHIDNMKIPFIRKIALFFSRKASGRAFDIA